MSAVIFTGLMWKRGNTKGAVGGVIVGFSVGLVFFLDQALGWKLPLLSHPLLHSFMHRTLVVWIIAAAAMIALSLVSQPADPNKATRNVLGEFTAPGRGSSDYRKWAGVLFLCTVVLWLSFR
jgi:Na+/proline symporter